MKNLIPSLLERLRHPKRSVSPSSGGGYELTEQQVLAALTKPAQVAFTNLRTAADIPPRPGFVPQAPGFVWARRKDIDILLAEMTVSVGIEVNLFAAKQVLAQIDQLIRIFQDDDPDKLVDDIAFLVKEYFDEGVNESDRQAVHNTDDGSFPVNTRVRLVVRGSVRTGIVVFRGEEVIDTNWRTVKFDDGGQWPCRAWYLEEIDADGNLIGRPAPGPPGLLG